jgi:hypothetical protein
MESERTFLLPPRRTPSLQLEAPGDEDDATIHQNICTSSQAMSRHIQSWSSQKKRIWVVGLSVATILSTLPFALGPAYNDTLSLWVQQQQDLQSSISRQYWDEQIHKWEHGLYELQQQQHQQQQQLLQLEQSQPRFGSKSSSPFNDHDELELEEQEINQPLIYLNHSVAFEMIHATDDSPEEYSIDNNKKRPRIAVPLSSTANDFFAYQQGWEAQFNQAYCGVATSTAILNSLRGKITLPQDQFYEPFPWATQRDVLFNQCVCDQVFSGVPADLTTTTSTTTNGNSNINTIANTNGNTVEGHRAIYGLGINMVGRLLTCHLDSQGYSVKVIHVDPQYMTVSDVRSILVNALSDPSARVLMNYDRGAMGQGDLGHGHFSPIGAYHQGTDSFLVLDVAKYKYPAVWASATHLFHGIATYDLCVDFTYPSYPPDFSKGNYLQIMQTLGCVPGYRGLVVVYPTST